MARLPSLACGHTIESAATTCKHRAGAKESALWVEDDDALEHGIRLQRDACGPGRVAFAAEALEDAARELPLEGIVRRVSGGGVEGTNQRHRHWHSQRLVEAEPPRRNVDSPAVLP